jgi:hypothetical protein
MNSGGRSPQDEEEDARGLPLYCGRRGKINVSSAREPSWLGAKGSRVQIPPPRPTSRRAAFELDVGALGFLIGPRRDGVGTPLETVVLSGVGAGLPLWRQARWAM